MASSYFETIMDYQHVICSNLKKSNFVPENGSEIFVKKIPADANIYQVFEFFQRAGNIFQVRLMMDDEKLYNRGFAFVQYLTSHAATQAINHLKNDSFLGYINLVMEKAINNSRLFIGGISGHKSNESLVKILAKRGVRGVVKVNVKSDGYAFVDFKSKEAASRFKLKYANSPLILWGRPVRINWCSTMEEDKQLVENNKVIYLKNLNKTVTYDDLGQFLCQFIERTRIVNILMDETNNSFCVKLASRQDGEYLFCVLKEFYRNTKVHVVWGTPPSVFEGHSEPIMALTGDDGVETRNVPLKTYFPEEIGDDRMTLESYYHVKQFIGDIL